MNDDYSAYPMEAMCAICRKTYGGHIGLRCSLFGGLFVLAVEEAKEAPDEMTFEELMEDLSEPGWSRIEPSPADLAMIARDGPAKPAVAAIPSAPKPPANPAPRGLTLSPDLRATSHMVEPVHGSVAVLTKHI